MRTLAAIFFAYFTLTSPALSCSASFNYTADEYIEKSAIIAHAKVVAARVLSETEASARFPDLDSLVVVKRVAEASLLIERAVKGAKKDDVITAYFNVSGTSCDLYPVVGLGSVYFIETYLGKNWVFLLGQDFFSEDRNAEYVDRFEQITGEDWGRWRR